ncbi:TonB-dependent receptor, partial [Paenibacillus dendritiformis]
YGGFTQAIDIAAIPVEAVERIEIVADGASAIYGSDAVGGVGNVILKRDYRGATLSALYGTATDGGMATREYAVTAGSVWAEGGLIATYKYSAVDPIYATDRSFTDLLTPPTTIYPGIDLQSGLISAHHALGDIAELRMDAFRTERDQTYGMLAPNGMINRATPDNTTTLVSPSLEFFLPNDWVMSIGGTWSKNEHVQVQAWQNIATWDSTVWIDECYCNKGHLYEVGAEGPLFGLPGGEARLAVGAGYRKNEFLHHNYLTDASLTTGDEGARFGYAEINLPLVGEESNIAGVRHIVLTAAARVEDYDSFGRVVTPKLGLIYGPSDDLTLKASWGRSFKAPTLFQRHYAPTAYLYYPAGFGGRDYPDDATVIFLDGGNSDLDPERARTWTASLAIHPEALPGLHAELTWFDIDYTDRVVQPIANAGEALSNPIFADFISHWPTPEEAEAAVSGADRLVNTIGVPFDPGSVAAIMHGQYRNVARQRIRGLDLTGSYWRDLATGRLTLRGSATWLDSSQQTTKSQSPMDLAGILHNPLKITGRMGAVWTQGGFTGSTFGNYKSGVENRALREKTGSFTTMDVTLRYATERHRGQASGLEFVLSVENILNRAPPLYTPARPLYVPPYDATNYSAIGRFVSVSVAKHW